MKSSTNLHPMNENFFAPAVQALSATRRAAAAAPASPPGMVAEIV
jgi:hypothetical protein